jgi:hypothetical protein
MDKINETHEGRPSEYTAPTIVDYGTLVELTARNGGSNLSDTPVGGVIAPGTTGRLS